MRVSYLGRRAGRKEARRAKSGTKENEKVRKEKVMKETGRRRRKLDGGRRIRTERRMDRREKSEGRGGER